MKAPPQSNRPNDDLLVSWKDIADYLKCSVRKAQRLETLELPVNRISGTKSVWASKSEIDRWLKLQAEKTKDRTPAEEIGGLTRSLPFHGRPWWLGIAIALALLTIGSASRPRTG